jgi:protein NRD1
MEELETLLQSLQALKPPGVTKTKIESITTLCIQNIQAESIIIQKIFTQFKKNPATHKLGVLYVVDSVTRQWVEKARQAGQVPPGSTAADGTFASGVQKMTDLLPVMMNELIQTAPENQKEKVSKLIDIWERGQTFPLQQLANFKQKLSAPQTNTQSFTPGSPPNNIVASLSSVPQVQEQPKPAAALAVSASPDAGSILAALANMGKQNASNVAPSAYSAQDNPKLVADPSYQYPQNVAPAPLQVATMPTYTAPVNAPTYGANGHAIALTPQYAPNANPLNPPAAQAAPAAPGANEMLIQLFQAIAQGLVPPDQAAQIMAALGLAQPGAVPLVPPPAQTQVQASSTSQNATQNDRQLDNYQENQPRGQRPGGDNGNNDYQNERYRERSRSPDYKRRRVTPPNRRTSPPNRRDSPTYGVYDPTTAVEGSNGNRSTEHERSRGRGRGRRNEYRQRSIPPAQRRQQSPAVNSAHNMQPKLIEFDDSLPRGSIRVLSRTLFVGGASATETELRNIFSRYGKVQSCIVNHEKRHAFVKMVNRHDALAAKEGMEKSQDPDISAKARQTRWGVGFGPRDCSDYNTGISVIPIDRLTDADRKWVLTAEYGGTGGRPIEGGMVIEEPDIEIGAGVSSKAISRRIAPDAGGRRGGGSHGPRGGFDSNAPRHRKPDRPEPRHVSPRPEAAIGVPPPVPGFGFQFSGMPGF